MDTSDATLPPLAPARRSYEVFGITLSRETLSLVALALCAGIVVGARIQRSAAKLHGCEDCERQRIETAHSIARGARDFERIRGERVGGGGEPGGSEGVSASPPAPSPAASGFGSFGPQERSGRPPIEPVGGDVVETDEGGVFPRIPADPAADPLATDEIFEEPRATRE